MAPSCGTSSWQPKHPLQDLPSELIAKQSRSVPRKAQNGQQTLKGLSLVLGGPSQRLSRIALRM